MAYKDEEFIDYEGWGEEHDLAFFTYCGTEGGRSRSPKKPQAVRQNLIKANAARKAKAELRRQREASQGQVSPENSNYTNGHKQVRMRIGHSGEGT